MARTSSPDLRRRLASSALLEDGYAVIDDVLPTAVADELKCAMETLRHGGGLRQHRFGFKSSATAPAQLYTKPSIFEAEIDDAVVGALAPRLRDTLSQLGLQQAARAAFPSLQLSADADAATIKLQCNEGADGCFPLHYDNAGPPSRRRLTALFYLNPKWRDGDGGELQLVPWLRPAVRVPPLHGRVVLFLSDAVLHRVLPSAARRFCFTIWLDGEGTNGPGTMQLDSRTPPAELHLHPSQRVLSRAVYSDEYAASIRQCFRATPEQMGAVLASHQQHVDALMANDAAARLVRRCRELKPTGRAPTPPRRLRPEDDAAAATSTTDKQEQLQLPPSRCPSTRPPPSSSKRRHHKPMPLVTVRMCALSAESALVVMSARYCLI